MAGYKNIILDFDAPGVKQTVASHVWSLKGNHRITIVKERKRRSDGQNRYFHGVVLQYFTAWCNEQGNDWTEDECKGELKRRFLSKTWTDEKTGEIFETTRKTSDLDTKEFMEFIDNVVFWMANSYGVKIPPPDPYYSREPEKQEPSE